MPNKIILKKLSNISFIVMVIILIIKMIFRDQYGFSVMIATTALGIIAVLLFVVSEIALMISKRKK